MGPAQIRDLHGMIEEVLDTYSVAAYDLPAITDAFVEQYFNVIVKHLPDDHRRIFRNGVKLEIDPHVRRRRSYGPDWAAGLASTEEQTDLFPDEERYRYFAKRLNGLTHFFVPSRKQKVAIWEMSTDEKEEVAEFLADKSRELLHHSHVFREWARFERQQFS